MPNEAGIVGGQKNESVFTEPFIDYRWSLNEMPSFMQRANAAGDDRSFVIFSFVVIERYLDDLLEAIAPAYQVLKDNNDFTVSLKTEILRALQLIPRRILQAIDMVRKVRNEFAHKDWDHLEQLPPKFRDPVANLVRQIFGSQPTYFTSVRETFQTLVFFVLAQLHQYRPNFQILREKLDDGTLTEELKLECHKRFMEGVDLRTRREPLRIEEKDGWRYSFYEDGLVSIRAADPNDPPKTPAVIPDQGVSRVLFGK